MEDRIARNKREWFDVMLTHIIESLFDHSIYAEHKTADKAVGKQKQTNESRKTKTI